MRLRHLLQIIDASCQRINVALGGSNLQHVQDHLGIFGIVLVPAIVQRFTRAGQCGRRDQEQLETCAQQAVCQCPMIVACSLKADYNRATLSMTL